MQNTTCNVSVSLVTFTAKNIGYEVPITNKINKLGRNIFKWKLLLKIVFY